MAFNLPTYRLNVNFTASTQSTSAGTGITFSDTTNGVVDRYYWEFGDGSFSTASNPNKIYTEAGTFSVSLTGANRFGGAFITKNDFINIKLTGLLDEYPDATAAYSVRKLRDGYTGSCMRIRRTSDNAEQDIGFASDGSLDETALTTFIGASSATVVLWYDQSGKNNTATQSTAASQPIIATNGTIEKRGGKPLLKFDGSNDFFNVGFTYSNANFNSFVGKRNNINQALASLGAATAAYLWALWVDNNYYFQSKTTGYTTGNSTDNTTSQVILTGQVSSSGTASIYKNGTEISSQFVSFTLGRNIDYIAQYAGTYTNGELQEIIYYNIDRTANRADIINNQNTYYGVY